jgi:hypothetical protein
MSDAREVAEAMIRAFNAHDLDAAASYYNPQSLYLSPSGTGEGPQEITSFFALYFEGFPDLQITPLNTTVCDNVVVTEWVLTGTHSGPFLVPGGQVIGPTGRCVSVRGCSVRTIENRLALIHRVYYDQLELFSQLGARIVPE